MTEGRLVDQDDVCVLPRVWIAQNAWERMRGLLGQKPLANDEGFWISPCASIHTIGMKYAIDAVFFDRENRIIKIVENLRPLRFAQAFRARATLELAAGTAKTYQLDVGDVLRWRED